jgi:general secretion pathway protein G
MPRARRRERLTCPDTSGAGRLRRATGFTLIELLIVVVILGILAAIVVFAVGAISDRGNNAACGSDRQTIQSAIGAYEAQNGAPPSSLLDLTAGNKYLHADPSITATSKVGEGYTLTYSAGQLSACGATPSAPPGSSTLAAPTNVVATLAINNKVDATWQQAAGVTYECTINAITTPPTTSGTACASPFQDNGDNTMTRFWIRAVNTAGETSPWVGVAL